MTILHKKILNENYPGLTFIESISIKDGVEKLIDSKEKAYIFKKHNSLVLNNFDSLEKIYQKCSQDFLCPKFIKPSNGNHIFSSNENAFFSLQEFEEPKREIPDPDVLVKSIANLHLSLFATEIPELENHLDKKTKKIFNLLKEYGLCEFSVYIEKFYENLKKDSLQVIHGDLHQGNILYNGSQVKFIDFDSATISSPVQDLAFSSFKFFNFDCFKVESYLDSYYKVTSKQFYLSELFYALIFIIIQRILFIKIECFEFNNQTYLWDLKNQEKALSEILKYKKKFVSFKC